MTMKITSSSGVCIYFSSERFSGGEIMEAMINLERLSEEQLVTLISQNAFSQDSLYKIASEYKENLFVCRAILQQATWIFLLNELSKSSDPEIRDEANRRKEAFSHPAQ